MTSQHEPARTASATADADDWRSYDEFAAGIDTYRLENADLSGARLELTLDDGSTLRVAFDGEEAVWSAEGPLAESGGLGGERRDPVDAVRVRDDVVFVNLPLVSRARESVTVIYSETTHRALVVHSRIAEHESAGAPRVGQTFWSAVTGAGAPTGDAPGPSRDLIGTRNLYRYSPHHLYEHVYLSSQRYAWQCIEGVQRGHGDTDLSTVWRFDDDLYLFCFREFRIAVASVWLHDLGSARRTTGVFLGITGAGEAEHSRAGGHIIPLGRVVYPDAQPV